MSFKQAFASLLYLFVVSAFFAVGLFFIAVSYLPQIQVLGIDFFTHHAEDGVWIGAAIVSLSALLALSFHALNPGRYLRLKMGSNRVIIDQKIVRKAVEEVFKEQKISLRGIDVVGGTRLEIGVEFEGAEEAERDLLLLKVEKELQHLLQSRFGYTNPFYLVVKV